MSSWTERPPPRDRNWGVTISWSHPDIEKLLPEDVFKRIRDCQPDPTLDSKERKCESVLLRDGKTGETMVEPPFPGIRRLNIQKTKNMWVKDVNIKVCWSFIWLWLWSSVSRQAIC